MTLNNRTETRVCIECKHLLIDCPGIGLYCPNPECKRIGDQRLESTGQQPGVCRHGRPHGDDCGACDLSPDASPCTVQQPAKLLAKHQPCGCIVCTCEDDLRCHGCGAKNCGTHPVGQMPNAVYEQQPAQPGNGEVVPRSRYNAANKDWLDEKAAHEKTRQAAADEIDRLQSALAAAQRRIAELEETMDELRADRQ